MSKKNIILFSLFLAIAILIFPQQGVSAQNLPNPLGNRTVPQIVGGVINGVLGLVGVIALVMFIYGGILWMTSGGKEEQIKKGKDTLIWAILGMALVFLSYALSNFVVSKLIEVAK
jgi:amino acid transporter